MVSHNMIQFLGGLLAVATVGLFGFLGGMAVRACQGFCFTCGGYYALNFLGVL